MCLPILEPWSDGFRKDEDMTRCVCVACAFVSIVAWGCIREIPLADDPRHIDSTVVLENSESPPDVPNASYDSTPIDDSDDANALMGDEGHGDTLNDPENEDGEGIEDNNCPISVAEIGSALVMVDDIVLLIGEESVVPDRTPMGYPDTIGEWLTDLKTRPIRSWKRL